MSIFDLFKRKGKKTKNSTRLNKSYANEEIIELMQDKGLNFNRYSVEEVVYSIDRSKRYVILKSDEDFITYSYQELSFYGEEELKFLSEGDVPAYWIGNDLIKRVFESLDDAKKELKAEPEYKSYFIENQDD